MFVEILAARAFYTLSLGEHFSFYEKTNGFVLFSDPQEASGATRMEQWLRLGVEGGECANHVSVLQGSC